MSACVTSRVGLTLILSDPHELNIDPNMVVSKKIPHRILLYLV